MKVETSMPAHLEKRYWDVRRLVDKYGVDSVKHALEQCTLAIEEEKHKSKSGRPLDYGHQQLMDVWLYVEEMAHRSGLSCSAVCKHKKAQFYWVTGGKPDIKPKIIRGATLLRRYQDAKSFLKEQSAFRKLPKGIKISIARVLVEEVSPIEKYWRHELQQRISQKK